MSDYEDNDFNDGYGYGDGYSDGEQEDYFGEDGYFGDEFGMDDEDGFQAEYGVTDRTTLEEDPWYKRMSKVPEIFKNYKLPENILNLLRKQYKFKMPTTMYGAFVQGQLSTRERISKINTSPKLSNDHSPGSRDTSEAVAASPQLPSLQPATPQP